MRGVPVAVVAQFALQVAFFVSEPSLVDAQEPSGRSEAAESDPAVPSAQRAPVVSPDQGPPGVTPARVRVLLARYRHEPSVADVVRAARAAQVISPTGSMASRARMAGWVPTVGLSARRGLGVDLSSASTADDGVRLSTDDDLAMTASLTFEFDRLVFRPEEISIAREDRAERGHRGDHIREVVRLYFLRRRLQLERDLGVGDAVAQALGIAEAEAVLDAFTNGAFGRMLRISRRR